MIHKMIKVLMGVVMLAAMTGAYASNTGVIEVTNKCNNALIVASVQSKPSGLSCWTARSPQKVGLGETVEFTDLDTECDYNVTGFDKLISVKFNSMKIYKAELVWSHPGHGGSCKLYTLLYRNKIK